MEGIIEAIGAMGLIFLLLVGLLAGWIASQVAGGRHKGRYMAMGVAGAVALPFILAALGVALMAMGGLVAVLFTALVGAVIVLVIAKMIFD